MTLTISRVAFFGAATTLTLALAGLVSLVLPASYQPFVLPGLLAAVVLVAAGLKIWNRPAIGVVAVVLLIGVPWGTGEEGQGTNVTLADLAATAFVGLVALRILVVGDGGRLRSWVVLPLAGVVMAGGIVTMTAQYPTESFIGLVRHAELFVVVPAAVYLALRDRRDLVLVLGATLALGIVEGAFGVYQYFTGTGAEYGDSNNRAVGTFGAYGIMAMAHIMTIAIIVSAAAFAVLKGNGRLWALCLGVGLCFPLAFSLSRGAWIATIAGVMAILALKNRKMLVLLVVAGGLALGIGSAVSEDDSGALTTRLTSIFSATSSPDQSVKDRYALWQAAREMWADEPLTGVGIRNFAELRDSYAPLSFSGGSDIADLSSGYRRVELLSPHSFYWLILAEHGLAGALAYGVLFLSLGVASLRRSLAIEGSTVEKIFGLACVGFLVNYLVSGIYMDIGGSTMLLNSVFLGGLMWVASGTDLVEEE